MFNLSILHHPRYRIDFLIDFLTTGEESIISAVRKRRLWSFSFGTDAQFVHANVLLLMFDLKSSVRGLLGNIH